ncbi:hypothetical protein BJV82DRAFT_614874 [Fennellomyces sp. T-0311]|nr:hypothetical protein BJV82DRAFT_614874 [Fennellomyces sp. T-0311]
MLHVPSTPIPESTGIPEWSLTDEQHDDGYFHNEDNFFFLHQHHELPPAPPPPPQLPPPLLESHEEEDFDEYTVDDTYETATRIFYATMQKFAKQGYHRRSFLESWHLHSMYSKSQQILLGIPNAQSMVYLSGDDFMFTPQLVPQEMEFDWEEQQPLAMADDGVMVMTAPAPEVMDENTWMRPHHSIDDDDGQVDIPAPTAPDHHQLDLVNWYRAGNPPPPSTIMDHDDADGINTNDHDDVDPHEEDEDNECATTRVISAPTANSNIEKGKESIRLNADEYISSIEKDLSIRDEEESTVLSYQSLADIIPPSQPVLPPPDSSYGTVAERSIQHDPAARDITQRLLQFPLLRSSDRLANAVLETFELAEELASGKATFYLFILYLVRIWQVLFLCAESLISIRRRPPLPPFYKRPQPSSNDEMV